MRHTVVVNSDQLESTVTALRYVGRVSTTILPVQMDYFGTLNFAAFERKFEKRIYDRSEG